MMCQYRRNAWVLVALLALAPGAALLAQSPSPADARLTASADRAMSAARDGAGTSSPLDAPMSRDDLDRVFRDATAWGFAGTVLVVQAGEVVLHSGYGEADRSTGLLNSPTTMYDIGDMPTDFTRVAVRLLVQRGQLSLDDPISRFYSSAPADKRQITVAQLLDGRSGLPDGHRRPTDSKGNLTPLDRAAAETRILGSPLLFPPGSSSAESRSATVLLAAIVERVSGSRYEDFVKNHILMPAGMTRTGFYGDSRGYSWTDFAVGHGAEPVGKPNIPPNWGPTSWLIMGSGGMYSTPWDMHRFVATLRAGRLLKEPALDQFLAGGSAIAESDRGYVFLRSWDGGESILLLAQNAACQTEESRQLHREMAGFVQRGFAF